MALWEMSEYVMLAAVWWQMAVFSYWIYWCVENGFTQGMDGLLEVAGIIIHDYGLDHSLIPYV